MRQGIGNKVLWMCFFFLWGIGIFYGLQIKASSGQISIRLFASEEGYTASQLERFEGEDVSLSAFEEKKKVVLTEPDSGRTTIADSLLVWGDKTRVYDIPLRFGSYGTGGVKECVISQKVARTLFQSEDPTGLNLIWKGESWLIRGVMKTREPLVLFTADQETQMKKLELFFHQSENYREEAEALLYKNQLNQQGTMIDFSLFAAISRVFFLLPGFFLWWCIRCRASVRWNQGWQRLLVRMSFWAGIFLLCRLTLRFPSYFIPSKWSDLDFWAERGRGISEALRQLNQSEPFYRELMLKRNMLISIGCSCLSLAGFIFLNTAVRLSKSR